MFDNAITLTVGGVATAMPLITFDGHESLRSARLASGLFRNLKIAHQAAKGPQNTQLRRHLAQLRQEVQDTNTGITAEDIINITMTSAKFSTNQAMIDLLTGFTNWLMANSAAATGRILDGES